MDWKNLHFDWNRARAFLATVEEGSFTSAAKALKLTQSTLGRQVSALEDELGVVLFERVGKGVEITPAGLELVEYVRKMGEAAHGFAIAATGKSTSIEGTVAITATEANAVYLLPGLLKKLRDEEPGIKVEVIATNASSDLRKREADIAIRNFMPNHPDLIAQKVKDAKAYLYASENYIREKGGFKRRSDIVKKGEFIGFRDNARYVDGLRVDLGIDLNSDHFVYTTENHIAHWGLVKAGAGIGVMVDYVADQDPEIKKILKSLPPFMIETWVVSHRELKTSHRIRYVFDFLVRELNKI